MRSNLFKRIWYSIKPIVYIVGGVIFFLLSLLSKIMFILIMVLFVLAVLAVIGFTVINWVRDRWNEYGSR